MKLQMITHGEKSTNQSRASPYVIPQRTLYSTNQKTESYHEMTNGLSNASAKSGGRGVGPQQLQIMSHIHAPAIHLEHQVCSDGLSAVSSEDLRLVEEHIRPLIKEELRYTIQSKRIARGLPSTVEIEYRKPQPDDVSPETLLKRERRRERNKVAAAKCRFKKKIVSEKLLEESEHLENLNLKLKREVQRLEEERQNLIHVLRIHQPNCVARDLNNDDTISNNMEPQVARASSEYEKSTSFAVVSSSENRFNNSVDILPQKAFTNQERTPSTYIDNMMSYPALSKSPALQRIVTQSC